MISLVIADAQEILREGVRRILEASSEVTVIGQAVDGLEAVQHAVSLLPDIMVLDVSMPRIDGIEACLRIRRQAPTVRILVLSQNDSYFYLTRVLEAGARGFVLKQGAVGELLLAVRVVMNGGLYLTPALTSEFVRRHFEREAERADRSKQLSDRELEVLKMIAGGMTNARISDSLNLSIKTVQSHRSNIMTKLSVHDRVDLVRYAIRVGLVSEEELLA